MKKKWNENHFMWNPSEHGNYSQILVNCSEIWRPKPKFFDEDGQEETILDESRLKCRIFI